MLRVDQIPKVERNSVITSIFAHPSPDDVVHRLANDLEYKLPQLLFVKMRG